MGRPDARLTPAEEATLRRDLAAARAEAAALRQEVVRLQAEVERRPAPAPDADVGALRSAVELCRAALLKVEWTAVDARCIAPHCLGQRGRGGHKPACSTFHALQVSARVLGL